MSGRTDIEQMRMEAAKAPNWVTFAADPRTRRSEEIVLSLWQDTGTLCKEYWKELAVTTWVKKGDIPTAFRTLVPCADDAATNPWTHQPFPSDLCTNAATTGFWLTTKEPAFSGLIDLYWCTAVPYAYLRALITKSAKHLLIPDRLHSDLTKIIRDNLFKGRGDKQVKEWLQASRPTGGTVLDLVDSPAEAPSVMAEFARVCLEFVANARPSGLYVIDDLDRIEARCLPFVFTDDHAASSTDGDGMPAGLGEGTVIPALAAEAEARFGAGAEVPLGTLRDDVTQRLASQNPGARWPSGEFISLVWGQLQLRAWERSLSRPSPLQIDEGSADYAGAETDSCSDPDLLSVHSSEVLHIWLPDAARDAYDDLPSDEKDHITLVDPADMEPPVPKKRRQFHTSPVEDAVLADPDDTLEHSVTLEGLSALFTPTEHTTPADLIVATEVIDRLPGRIEVLAARENHQGVKKVLRLLAITVQRELRQQGRLAGKRSARAERVVDLIVRARRHSLARSGGTDQEGEGVNDQG